MSSSIFHDGPLNTAITSAVQQDLFLVFFVTDDGEESKKWETVYLASPEILPILRKQCILLRLGQGSTEADFLTAFCPAQKVPYMVVVKNGTLIASIPSNIASRAEFVERVKSIIPVTGLLSPTTSGPSGSGNSLADIFAERKARLDAQEGKRKAQEKEERDKRIAREKARREQESPARAKYVAEQKKLREDDIAEKLRILRLVENDKIERRAKEARKQQAKLGHQSSASMQVAAPVLPSENEIAISFRLLDGTILKSKFLSSSKLKEVRQWLDQNRTDPGYPYGFQLVLPNKSLSTSDENSSLRDLSFSHATTLVLVHRDE